MVLAVIEVLDDDLVRGALFAPVALVANEANELTRLPLDGLVRAGPDDRGLVLEVAVRLRVLDLLDRVLAPDVLGQDRHIRLRQERGGEGRLGDERVALAGDAFEAGVGQVGLEVVRPEAAIFGLERIEDELVGPARVLARGRLTV
jgi:hypothetical protein